MSGNRIKALSAMVTVTVIAGTGLLLGFIAWRYLTEYPSHTLIAAAVVGVSLTLAIGIVWLLSRRRSAGWIASAAIACVGLCLVVIGSVAWGGVTHSSFGLTVVGALPLPVLDITIDSNGILWFRDKTHRVTLDEVLPLIDDETELVIIGNGWRGVARVDAAVRDRFGDRLRVLRTGEALDAWNAARAEGRRVVLLVHSTC